MINTTIQTRIDCWIPVYSGPKAIIPNDSCSDCARIWRLANKQQKVRFLQVLQPKPLGPLQGVAVEHLQEKHGVGSLGLDGVGGVWLCGVFSGLDFSDTTSGSTFSDRVRNELGYRARLTRQTLQSITAIHRLFRETGILTESSVRDAAVRLRSSDDPDAEVATLAAEFMQTIASVAFDHARRVVEPS